MRRQEMKDRAFQQFNALKMELREQGRDDEADRVRVPRRCWCGCSLKGGDGVEVRSLDDGEHHRAHFAGVQYCGGVWVCPVCGAIIRNRRAQEVAQAVENWQGRGGGLYLVTMTIRHHRGDDLGAMLDVISQAWRRVVSGRSWQRFRERIGIQGYVRTLEITYGSNGWHPHFHFLFFTSERASAEVAGEMERVILSRWIRYVDQLGGKLPNSHGCDVRPVDAYGKIAGGYVAKVAGEEHISLELARLDLKENDECGSVTPFQLLDVDTPHARALWDAYVDATRRKRSVFFSRDLRKLVGLGEEKTDDEIIDELESCGELRAVIDGELFDGMQRSAPGRLDGILCAVERGDFEDAAALCGGVLAFDLRLDLRTGSRARVAVIRPAPD